MFLIDTGDPKAGVFFRSPVCGPVPWSFGIYELKAHIVTRQVDGEELQLLSLAGLLLTKQGARPKDQADAQVLRAALAVLSKA